jgi:hypothetical protein
VWFGTTRWCRNSNRETSRRRSRTSKGSGSSEASLGPNQTVTLLCLQPTHQHHPIRPKRSVKTAEADLSLKLRSPASRT